MELTKEHFDQQIAKLATKDDVHREVQDGVEALARIVENTIATPFTKRFDQLEELLTVKEEVQTLKRQVSEIRAAVSDHQKSSFFGLSPEVSNIISPKAPSSVRSSPYRV
jgi:hypothetical protein